MAPLARWCFHHRRIVLSAWLFALVLIWGVSHAVGSSYANNFSFPSTDSSKAQDIVQANFATQAGDSDQIVVQAKTGTLASPERGEQWEGGVKTSLLSGRMVNSISVYRLTRSNVLTPDPNHPNFYLLTGKQRSKGVELETTFQLHRTWNLILAYAFTEAYVVEDSLIPVGTPTKNVPRNSANVWSTYELQHGWLEALSELRS